MGSLAKLLINDPKQGLFKKCDTPEISYNVDPYSAFIPDYSNKFTLLGKIMGKALFERIPLNLCLALTIYKVILEEVISFHDVKFLDYYVILLIFPI